MAIYDDVRKALQELIVPEIKNLQLEIQSLKVEIRRLDEKIDSLRSEMMSEFRRVDSRIESLEKELHLAIDIRERLAALESKISS